MLTWRQVLTQRPGPRVLVAFGLGMVVAALGWVEAVVDGVWGKGGAGVVIGLVIAGRAVIELRTLRSRWRPDETFFVVASADLAVAKRIVAELARLDGDLPITAWPAIDPEPGVGQARFALAPDAHAWVESIVPGGIPAGPRPDEQLIRRALGVVVLVSSASARSSTVHAHLETAYSEGVAVIGVRVDDTEDRPSGLPRSSVTPYEPAALVAAISSWREQRRQLKTMGLRDRVRRALVADRDARA